MRKILLALPVIFSILAMSPAMAALKPYCQEKITTSAFDYFPKTIDAKDAVGNDIDIYYLEYGRADAMVTKTWIPYTDTGNVFYQGKLYFYAKGLWLPDPNKLATKTWTVTLISEGNIYCDEFSKTDMTCAAMGTYKVSKNGGSGEVPVCIEFVSYAANSEDSYKDKIFVKAYKDGTVNEDGTCTDGTLYLDAETSCYFIRVPKQHVIFNWWDNFGRFPVCKWMQRDSMPA
jgi:hypothetical protein